MMKTKLMMLVMLSALLLAACGAPITPPIAPTSPLSVPTSPPSVLPTQPPSPLPVVKPGGGLVTQPEADVWKNAPAAALNSRADLTQRLQVDPDTIKLVSVEQVDWPDGCLGVQTPGIMCTMVITSGYRIILEANGQQYEYHTNANGSAVRLATVK